MMAYRDLLYLRNVMYLSGGMMEPKRFDSDVSFDCIYVDDGNLVFASEALAAIAERDTRITELEEFCRTSLATMRKDVDDLVSEKFAVIATKNATIERLRAELEAEQARTICAMCGEELTRMAQGLEEKQP